MLGLLLALFFDPGRQGCGLCPANLVLVRPEPGLADGLQRVGLAFGLAWAAALVAAGMRRLARASPPLRRMLWPVLAPAGCYVLLAGADPGAQPQDRRGPRRAHPGQARLGRHPDYHRRVLAVLAFLRS